MGGMRAYSKLSADLARRWDAFVAAHPRASLYHHSRWIAFASEVFGFDAIWLTRETAVGEITGVLPMIRQRSRLFGDRWVSLPYFNYGGPLAADAEAGAALISAATDHARRTGVRTLEIRDLEARAGFARRTDKATLILELPDSADGLAEQLGAKLRSQIRRADREQPAVVRGGAELLDEFYGVFAETMRDLGTPVQSRRFFESMLDRVGSDCQIVTVRLAGRTAAAALLTRHRQTVEIPWAGSLREFRPAAANMRLYWECLKFAVESGSRYFDFGRSTVDSGTWRFKLQWGARPVPLYWYYPLVPEDVVLAPREGRLLEMARAAWRRLPVSLASFMAARFSAGLPW